VRDVLALPRGCEQLLRDPLPAAGRSPFGAPASSWLCHDQAIDIAREYSSAGRTSGIGFRLLLLTASSSRPPCHCCSSPTDWIGTRAALPATIWGGGSRPPWRSSRRSLPSLYFRQNCISGPMSGSSPRSYNAWNVTASNILISRRHDRRRVCRSCPPSLSPARLGFGARFVARPLPVPQHAARCRYVILCVLPLLVSNEASFRWSGRWPIGWVCFPSRAFPALDLLPAAYRRPSSIGAHPGSQPRRADGRVFLI